MSSRNLTKHILPAALMLSMFPNIASTQQTMTAADTAKLRLVMKEPVATDLHISVIETGSCKSVSDVWVTGGVKSFYDKQIGMLDSKPSREGIVEVIIPTSSPIGFATNMHIAKLRWSEILFSGNPAMQSSIAGKKPGICEFPTFTPKPAGQYELTIDAGPGYCHVIANELSETNGTVVRTQITGMQNLSVRKTGRKKYECGAP